MSSTDRRLIYRKAIISDRSWILIMMMIFLHLILSLLMHVNCEWHAMRRRAVEVVWASILFWWHLNSSEIFLIYFRYGLINMSHRHPCVLALVHRADKERFNDSIHLSIWEASRRWYQIRFSPFYCFAVPRFHPVNRNEFRPGCGG